MSKYINNQYSPNLGEIAQWKALRVRFEKLRVRDPAEYEIFFCICAKFGNN